LKRYQDCDIIGAKISNLEKSLKSLKDLADAAVRPAARILACASCSKKRRPFGAFVDTELKSGVTFDDVSQRLA
jgi:hypothetical protein